MHSAEPPMRYRSASTFDLDKPYFALLILVQYFRIKLQKGISDFGFLGTGVLRISAETKLFCCCFVDTHFRKSMIVVFQYRDLGRH